MDRVRAVDPVTPWICWLEGAGLQNGGVMIVDGVSPKEEGRVWGEVGDNSKLALHQEAGLARGPGCGVPTPPEPCYGWGWRLVLQVGGGSAEGRALARAAAAF